MKRWFIVAKFRDSAEALMYYDNCEEGEEFEFELHIKGIWWEIRRRKIIC